MEFDNTFNQTMTTTHSQSSSSFSFNYPAAAAATSLFGFQPNLQAISYFRSSLSHNLQPFQGNLNDNHNYPCVDYHNGNNYYNQEKFNGKEESFSDSDNSDKEFHYHQDDGETNFIQTLEGKKEKGETVCCVCQHKTEINRRIHLFTPKGLSNQYQQRLARASVFLTVKDNNENNNQLYQIPKFKEGDNGSQYFLQEVLDKVEEL